ncbi:GH36-type glycosyl hydrolase domain-containing protein [Steroidobacter flavus]|uniref:GH36-type glycosyl hydrolase domain-containing protein n=1 Tax=Steroidobacter flavus TaxID=1842136 RepID=A0ABV8SR79_9GAMM
MPLSPARLESPAGLTVELLENGAVRRLDHGDTIVNLFIGNELEGGVANLYLRRLNADAMQYIELLGPRSPTRFRRTADSWLGSGEWSGIRYTVQLRLASSAPAWFWQIGLENSAGSTQQVDVIYAQDVALSPYATVRLNEFYVSQYVDHTPLKHPKHGHVIASRQNLAAGGQHPWSAIGSLRRAQSFATDAMQVHGLATRAGRSPLGVVQGLPGQRLQHEHSMVAIQDEPLELKPGERATTGFFGCFSADHPEATSLDDLDAVDKVLGLPEAELSELAAAGGDESNNATLFSEAPLLGALDLQADELSRLFSAKRRHEEVDEQGAVLSFFYDADRHVVLRAKEQRVVRPHGHLLRSGRHATPDELGLTSTVWMNGVFHSMLTQGHVSFNRLLSTVHSYLSLFRSHGLRLFVELEGQWRLLDMPSAFEIQPGACRWLYKHAGGLIEVRSEAHAEHELTLRVEVLAGAPVRWLVSSHVALNGDDGSVLGAVRWRQDGDAIVIQPAEGSELERRFPQGSFTLTPHEGTKLERVGGDELLFKDERSRQQPYVCSVVSASKAFGLVLRGDFVTESNDVPTPHGEQLVELLGIDAPAGSPLSAQVEQLVEILPWFKHNALVHYLSPRGLEQYSGGGWGTRDVTQGPVEMLLALGNFQPIRDLLIRVMKAQTSDGDWPQWFMFFERERDIRAGDSHGDIVFWPLLALAQYLIASGDSSILDEPVPFFSSGHTKPPVSLWKHVERALKVIERRIVEGTALAAYGHGDWNDALQPADPAMRERMCSAWTVTLHHQVLTTLAHALRSIGREQEAARFDTWAANVKRDFQKVLLVDGVLTGYALFEEEGNVNYLLHPRDSITGVRYSSLAMIHAILEDLFDAEQLQQHLRLIDLQLSGPDGVRLFDRPMNYHGGPQRFFQRAESATFFGREIGLMYMHAHLRYAQALARVGETDRFFRALCQANPIGIQSLVPSATLRQANCYYSSSDAAFADRYQASDEYDRVNQGTVPLDGGWRVYSSGAGIGLGLIVRRFLGLSIEACDVTFDPVIPAGLNGLRVRISLFGKPVTLSYEITGAGHGVSSVIVNGQAMSLSHDANPYRTGAARVERALLVDKLDRADNTIQIKVG